MNNNNVWGPPAWTFLHIVTYNYPENPTNEDKSNYLNFFDSLKHVIPCNKCKGHYKENLKKYDLNNSLDSRQDLVKWLIDLHNDVNRDNGKSVCTDTRKTWSLKNLTFEKTKNKFITFYKYKLKYPHAGAGKRVQF